MSVKANILLEKSDYEAESIPVGPVGLVPLKGTEKIVSAIDAFLVQWRKERVSKETKTLAYMGYNKDSFMVDYELSRFKSGEGKGIINSPIRGLDLYFFVDITNHSITYNIGSVENHYSPDDHYQDLKRLIAAVAGKARRMTVIMPFLYEGRVHNRSLRESLDCAQMLKELINMGITNVITFDANDPRVYNAIPLSSFDTISPSYQYIKAVCNKYDDIIIDSPHLMTISPDEAGVNRAIYLANVLSVDMGMFYERRDYSLQKNGEYPVLSHEYLGAEVAGKDVIIVDDMISSGHSILDVAIQLKNKKAQRVICCVSYGLFTYGFDMFDKAYEDGIIDSVFTTNLIYQPKELLLRKWYGSVNMEKYVALLIDYINHDYSISKLLTPTERITRFVSRYKDRQRNKGIAV